MKKSTFLFILLFSTCPIFASAEQININSATLAQLDKIEHVGAKTAQKIIDGRPYSSVSDLSRVKGIGSGKYLQDIINQGWACVNCETTESPATAESSKVVDNTATDKTATAEPATASNDTKEATPYPGGVSINEIMPNPEGADETDEWIVPTMHKIASVCS